MRAYSHIRVDKRFRHPIKPSGKHAELITTASAFAAHRVFLTEAAYDKPISELSEMLDHDYAADFFDHLITTLAELKLTTVEARDELTTALRNLSEDLDAATLALRVIKDPVNAPRAAEDLRQISQHTPQNAGERLSEYAERVLRLHLQRGLPAIMNAVLVCVGKLALAHYPGEIRRQSNLVARYVGCVQAATDGQFIL